MDRTEPSLPMVPGPAGTMTHDYKRDGTTDLFAAMNLATGQVLTHCHKGRIQVIIVRLRRCEFHSRPRAPTVWRGPWSSG